MSGHSKWSQIKRQKGVADAKRGQVFTKIGNAVTIAVKEGASEDPTTNFKLRLAIDQAKAANMPKENIQRAIDRGSGKVGGLQIEEITYEGYGPAGIAILAKAVTDNRNRTTAEVKSIVERNGGNLAGPGSVGWMFIDQGEITILKNNLNFDQIFDLVVEAGADDVEDAESSVIVYTKPDELESIKNNLTEGGLSVESAEISKKATNTVKIEDGNIAKKILALIDKLENIDDIYKVYANFDIPDNLLDGMQGS